METHGSIANELYSDILKSSSDLDRRSTTMQANDNFHDGDPGDMWYDDGSPEDSIEKSSKASDMDREWRRRHNQFHNLGYRDGVIAGKEAALQEGFNIGFRNSVLSGYNWGLVRGISSAMAALPSGLKKKMVEREETRNKFQQLHESVQCISSTESLKLFYEDQQQTSPKQKETKTKPSSTENDQNNQSASAGVLEDYHVRLLSILQESPLVEGNSKTS